MRKLASVCVALAFVALAFSPAFATTPSKKKPAPPAEVSGTVGTVDAKAMSLSVKDDKGEEKTIFWSSKTKIVGKDGKSAKADAIQQGGTVTVKASERSGEWWATAVSIK